MKPRSIIEKAEIERLREENRQLKNKLNEVYHQRAMAVQAAVIFAQKIGLETGIRTPTEDPDWPVLVIDIKEGEIAWHMHKDDLFITHKLEKPYDGHTDEEKDDRIKKLYSLIKK